LRNTLHIGARRIFRL